MPKPRHVLKTVVARPRRVVARRLDSWLRVLDRIGEGGMAEIYLGETRQPEEFRHRVVIKKVHPRFADDARIVEMLIQEARLAASLTHPNIVQILDLGMNERQEYCIVMEHVDGRDLRGLLGASPLPLPLDCALYIIAEICAALDHMHRKTDAHGHPLGLVHRDVSPSNILISVDGQVKLADFGLARTGAAQSFNGCIEGKVPYMSPEHARGLPVDRRSDIYSVGLVLFELVVGRRLFDDDRAEPLLCQVREAGGQRAVIEAGLLPLLEQILLRCLACEPDARFQSMAELELAVRELLRRLCMHLVGARRLATLLAERCRPSPPDRAPVTISLWRARPVRAASARRWVSQRTHYASYHEDDTTKRAMRGVA